MESDNISEEVLKEVLSSPEMLMEDDLPYEDVGAFLSSSLMIIPNFATTNPSAMTAMPVLSHAR